MRSNHIKNSCDFPFFCAHSSNLRSASFEAKFAFDCAKRIYFSKALLWWACGARQTERGGYEIRWNLKKSWILSKILVFEGYLWASWRAPMPWRALKLTGMKSWMNLEAFRTLNRCNISKTHEKNSDWSLINTARDHLDLELNLVRNLLAFSACKLRRSRAVSIKI